jgi:hypothetical protein
MKLLKYTKFSDVVVGDKVYCAIHSDGRISATDSLQGCRTGKFRNRVSIEFEDKVVLNNFAADSLDVFYVGNKDSIRDTSWVPLSSIPYDKIIVGDIVSSARGIPGVVKNKKQLSTTDPDRMYIYIEWCTVSALDSAVAHSLAQCILKKCAS